MLLLAAKQTYLLSIVLSEFLPSPFKGIEKLEVFQDIKISAYISTLNIATRRNNWY